MSQNIYNRYLNDDCSPRKQEIYRVADRVIQKSTQTKVTSPVQTTWLMEPKIQTKAIK